MEYFIDRDDEYWKKDDIDLILDFLESLRTQLLHFRSNFEKFAPRHKEFYQDFQEAWEEFEPNFKKMETYLKSNKQVREKLSDEGLTGKQLKLKLRIYYEALSRAMSEGEKDLSESSLNERGKGRSVLRKLFRVVLEHGDTIMGSLSVIGIPGAGAVKEVRDVAEKLTKPKIR